MSSSPVQRWRRLDTETLELPTAELEVEPQVDHAASAKKNFEATLLDLWHAGPDKFLEGLQQAARAGHPLEALLVGTFMAGGGLVYDAFEAPIMLVGAAKDLADTAIHGLLAGLQT